jgi:hypothetical protein
MFAYRAFAYLLIAIVLIILAVVVGKHAARAQQPSTCMPYTELERAAGDDYGERKLLSLMVDGSHMYVWFARSDGDQTWTLAVVMPSGMACIVAVGTGWIDLRPTLPGRPS